MSTENNSHVIAWDTEYQSTQGVPTSTRSEPSAALNRFHAFLTKYPEISIGSKVIDLGCGIGRNSVHLAIQGFEVEAVDFSAHALAKFRRAHEGNEYMTRINTTQADLSQPLAYEDDTFDLALDIVTSMTMPDEHRRSLVSEVGRILRPGGILLTYVLSDNDGFLAEKSPGAHSLSIAASGITDYYLTREELLEPLEQWEILALDETEKRDVFYGGEYTRKLWWGLFKNPA